MIAPSRGSCRGLLCALLLAGCAHPPRAELAPDLRVVQAVPPASDSSVEPERHDFADLFERMRLGFALPAVEHVSVSREIEWYQGHAGFLERTFGRARLYLHHIVETLEERNMPRELALLPAVESAFDPFAYSRCLASGLWQFLPSTGRSYGLDQDWWTDDRRDVVAATRAALDHLEALHAEFEGDWLLALAAYNAGSGSVRRAVERNQRNGLPTDFFHLDLPAETRAYVPKLLAISRLVAEPGAFGVALPTIPNAPYFARVDLEHQVDLGKVADLAQIPRDELRALNPEFNRWATAPEGPHHLLVPVPAKERFETLLAALPQEARLRLAHHRVRRGDTLNAIARRHRVSVEALRGANGIRGSLIHPGQDLLVPLPYRVNV
jgi:membrane-bound lytic murein transglycosylase D